MKLRLVSISATKARHPPSPTSCSNCKPKFKCLRSKASHIDLLTVLKVRSEKRIIKRVIRKERNKERNRDWYPTNFLIDNAKHTRASPFLILKYWFLQNLEVLRVWDEGRWSFGLSRVFKFWAFWHIKRKWKEKKKTKKETFVCSVKWIDRWLNFKWGT